jgi:uncharacterized protein (TIRG00374 family)
LKRWRLGLLGAAVSLLAIYFFLSQIDFSAFITALANANYIYIIPAFLLLLLGLFTRAVRWSILLGGALPLKRAFSILNVSYLVNGVLPLRIGELARVYLATRIQPPVPMLKTASTIIVERLLDLLAVLILLGIVLAAGPLPDNLRRTAAVLLPLVFLGFLALVFLSSQRGLAHRLLTLTLGRLRPSASKKLAVWLDHFLDGLQPLTQPRALFLALSWTAISWVLSVAAGYVFMLSFFPQASWIASCLFVAAATFAIAVPAVPGNLGPYELSIVLALGAVGYGDPRDTASAFAFAVHGLNLGLYALMGIIGFLQEGISLGQLSQSVQNMRQATPDTVSSE